MADVAAAQSTRPPFWRDVRVLRIAGQVLFVLVVLAVFREIWLNLRFGVRLQGIDLSWGFLQERAGFGIKEGIRYTPNDTVTRAYTVAVMNTIRVAGVGVVLASFLGLVIGVARLSPNWLMRKIAQVYVDVLRNTPVLVIIIFVYSAVVLQLPLIGGGSIFDIAFVSNRGAAFPWPRMGENAGLWGLILLGGLAAGRIAWRWRTRFNERTGRPHHRVLWAFGTLAAIGAGSFVALGSPVVMEVPELVGLGYEGGVQISGEFFGILTGLVIYTSAFIAEIVRGSILAVEKGQKEAAEALGLTPFQQLRFVVLPQALRIAIPPINSQYLNLTKNSSLAIAVAYPEIVAVGSTVINQKGRFTQVVIMWMLTYLTISLSVSAVMNAINRVVAYRGVRR